MGEPIKGAQVIVSLAKRFPQLYITPHERSETAYEDAVGRGKVPQGASLAHFKTTPDDELREVETPAGPIEVIFLANRTDFETFLQIVGHRARPVPIARTVGAITYRGLNDWGKVAAAFAAYQLRGGTDWGSEFCRLAKTPGSFRSELIVISEGPYSNIPAFATPYDEQEWLCVSREIRLYHECAHVVCRRLMPDDILPVWDEITADVTGLICATGHYDADLAARFLGASEDGFVGGRLSEYQLPEQVKSIDAVAREVYAVLQRIEKLSQSIEASQAFDFLLVLKRDPLVKY